LYWPATAGLFLLSPATNGRHSVESSSLSALIRHWPATAGLFFLSLATNGRHSVESSSLLALTQHWPATAALFFLSPATNGAIRLRVRVSPRSLFRRKVGQNPYLLPFFSPATVLVASNRPCCQRQFVLPAIDFIAQDLLSSRFLRLIPHFGLILGICGKGRKIVNINVLAFYVCGSVNS
jgi:hypothetical protein